MALPQSTAASFADAAPGLAGQWSGAKDFRPSLTEVITSGGDSRLKLNPEGLNAYGYGALPGPSDVEFGSCTGSTLSFDAQFRVTEVWDALETTTDHSAYAKALDRIRGRLRAVLAGPDRPLFQPDIILTASGTDAHLVLSELVRAADPRPLTVVMVDPGDTGSGAADALAGRHFASETCRGRRVLKGDAVGAALYPVETTCLSLRDDSGLPRAAAVIAQEFEAAVKAALRRGRQVLAVMAEMSKTGRIEPGVGVLLDIARTHPLDVTCAVDACQFRCRPEVLRAYLDQGLAVMITGSKFFTGPAYSGALVLPEALAATYSRAKAPQSLEAYAARGDFPAHWRQGGLRDAPNFGLVLRWEAALFEMERFLALEETRVASFFQTLMDIAGAYVLAEPGLEAVASPKLDRSELGLGAGWDDLQTILTFRVRDKHGAWLDEAGLRALYRQAMALPRPARLGQPVRCGGTAEQPIFALRFCASARLAVLALSSTTMRQKVLEEAVYALKTVAELAEQ